MEFLSLHLFAGAGGGILADKLLGFRPIGAVEIDAYCRQVLLSRQADGCLPDFPLWDDVRTFRRDNPDTRNFIDRCYAVRDRLILCGGFPCQDISCAGLGAGIHGKRSGLWTEFARITGEIRPIVTFVENSNQLVRRGVDVVLGDLDELGYDVAWGVFSAANVGAPHLRKRFWELASDETFPTPTVNMAKNAVTESQLKRKTIDLINYVAMYPTPCIHGVSGGSGNVRKIKAIQHLTLEEKLSMQAGNGGKINPEWVEWLMGWVIGWTTVRPELFGTTGNTACHDSSNAAPTDVKN